MIAEVTKSTPLTDLESGSVVKALLDMQAVDERQRLVSFLAKLDSRFNKYQDPWVGLRFCQVISKL